MMKSEIVKYDMELSEFNDPRIRWDYLKYRIRQFARRYSIDKARGRREKRKDSEQKVKELETLISTGLRNAVFKNTTNVSKILKKFIIILLRVSF